MKQTCPIPRCSFRHERGSSYCAHCGGLVDQMERMVREESPASSRMYVGRSKDPYERLLAHMQEKGLTCVRMLLASDDPYRLCAFESALIERVSYLYKLSNRTTQSLGRLRTDVTNYLYVAWRPKHVATGLTGSQFHRFRR
jgi:hypothetical protein